MRPCRTSTLALAAAGALCLALALPATAGAAPAAAEDPTGAIKRANDRLRSLLGEKAEDKAARERLNKQITAELRQLLDIGYLAERALVDHWEKMSPKQRTELQTTLQQIVEKNYLSQLRGNLEYKTDYTGEERKGEDVRVKTVIRAQRSGRPAKISVDYWLRPEGGGWRIFDVVTEDVSILRNYRQQFNRIIAKDGVDGLIAKMKSKLDKGGE